MKCNWLNLIVDLVTTVVLIALIWTGLLLYFVLPPGSGREGFGVWGLGRHDWGEVHLWSSVVVLTLMFVHVVLHWQWVCTMVAKALASEKDGNNPGPATHNIAGAISLVLLVGLIGGGLWLAKVTRVSSDDFREHHNQQLRETSHSNEAHITGSMTISQVARQLGVEEYRVIDVLGLPGDIDTQHRIGAAARHAGKSMSQARQLLEELKQSDK